MSVQVTHIREIFNFFTTFTRVALCRVDGRAHRGTLTRVTCSRAARVCRRSATRGGAFRFRGALGVEALELVRLVIDVAHRHRDRAMSGLLRDEPMHLLRDAPIRGMTLR